MLKATAPDCSKINIRKKRARTDNKRLNVFERLEVTTEGMGSKKSHKVLNV